jgi:hypothetical protein
MSITIRTMMDSVANGIVLSGCTCAEVEVRFRDENGDDYTDDQLDLDLAGRVVLMSVAHDDGCPLTT